MKLKPILLTAGAVVVVALVWRAYRRAHPNGDNPFASTNNVRDAAAEQSATQVMGVEFPE